MVINEDEEDEDEEDEEDEDDEEDEEEDEEEEDEEDEAGPVLRHLIEKTAWPRKLLSLNISKSRTQNRMSAMSGLMMSKTKTSFHTGFKPLSTGRQSETEISLITSQLTSIQVIRITSVWGKVAQW